MSGHIVEGRFRFATDDPIDWTEMDEAVAEMQDALSARFIASRVDVLLVDGNGAAERREEDGR